MAKRVLVRLLAGLCAFTVVPAHAVDFEDVKKMVAESETRLNFRYRYEFVDQDGIDKEAGASTLRSRLTWNSAALDGWTVGVEADYVALVGDENYNSTANGSTQYPVVADPEGFDLNQAFVKYSDDKFTGTAGRQRILQADQRFVGGVGWRQNEQTYDALRLQVKASDKLAIDYSYVWNVNRIFGPDDGAQPSDWRSDSHFVSARYAVNDNQSLEGFAYLLDFDNANGIPNSTATYGISYQGTVGPLKLGATYATQSDYADSPLDYDADYYALSAAVKFKPVTVNAGYAVLGSDDGAVGFRTPLATLHKWQGWADKFLTTPGTGIEDAYIGVNGAVGPVKLALTYHDFSAEEGSSDYGNEIDLVATYTVTKGVSLQLKMADYRADEFATDTTKVWFTFNVAL